MSSSSVECNMDESCERISIPRFVEESSAFSGELEQQRNDSCALVRRHRVIADHNGVHATYRYGPDRLMFGSPLRRHRIIADLNGVHATYRYGPDRLMLRSPLLSNDENFPRLADPFPVRRCTRNYALILRTGVRRVRTGVDDSYSHMSRGTLRALASRGALADYSLDGYVVDGNSSNSVIRAALRRRDES